MYTITYKDQSFKQWSSEYVFNTFTDAKGYLEGRGFKGNGGVMEREITGWCEKLKAYIELRKVYGGE